MSTRKGQSGPSPSADKQTKRKRASASQLKSESSIESKRKTRKPGSSDQSKNRRLKVLKLDCQVDKNEHFRHHLLFAFNRGAKAAEAAREICDVYGQTAMRERTARNWFAKFKNGIFDLKDAPRSGRPSEFDEARLLQLLEENPYQSTRKLAEKMECAHGTIENHLRVMEKSCQLKKSSLEVKTEN